MGKETYLIEEYWHDEVTAYCTAFGILGERESPKEGFDQSTDFNNLVSYFPTDTIHVATFLNNGSSIITTDDGSTYTYSGFGLSVVGGYSWYFEDAISIVLGAGPLFSSESRESENIKSDNGFGTDADDRIEKLNFLPIVPLLFVGLTF